MPGARRSWRRRHEEERILDELSALVEARAEGAGRDAAALATFDLWIARARLAEQMDASARAERSRSTTSSCCRPAIRG
jgi:dsDNA-specific endonuclease/ATPase MutS2